MGKNQQVSDTVKQYHDRLYGFAWVTKRALYLIEPDQQLSILGIDLPELIYSSSLLEQYR